MEEDSTELFKMLGDLGSVVTRYANDMMKLSNVKVKVVGIPEKVARYLGKKGITVYVDVPEGAVFTYVCDPPDIFRYRIEKASLVIGSGIHAVFYTEGGGFEIRLDKMYAKDVLLLSANRELVKHVIRKSLEVLRGYVEVLDEALSLAKKLDAMYRLVEG